MYILRTEKVREVMNVPECSTSKLNTRSVICIADTKFHYCIETLILFK